MGRAEDGKLVARLREKITTPEHVVDKATKLETIYDRIHEIRMRFEVLKKEKVKLACSKKEYSSFAR
ncbi:hypothetical protein QW180_19650 [Vibrio sinaloensis]|nr:hypothetical protein [Vibrio sinaloensis]